MDETEVDMDELEARLYGQVHHMPDSTEEVAPQPNLQNTPANNAMRYYNRPISAPTPANYDKFGVYSIPVMSPPINNIVVLPPPATQIFTHRSHSQKWVEQIIQACSKNKRAIRKLKQKRRRERKKLANASANSDLDSSIISTIDLSESCELKKDTKNVCLISDDESSSSNDVIIVETKAEVINVDCEIEPIASERELDHIGDPPLASEPPALPPDSLNVCDSNASFDFLDNPGLCKGLTSTPNAKKETSSGRSSTLDYCDNTAEIAGPSSSTFSELNLDAFTSYIASNGKRTADDASLSLSLASKRQRRVSGDSSDSSSESDAEVDPPADSETVGESGVQKEEEKVVAVNESVPKFEILKNDDDEKLKMKIDTVIEESDVICIEDDTCDEVSQSIEGFSKYWTDDMDKFYTESWGQEDFSVIEQQRLMSDDPNMWKVIEKDRRNTSKWRDPRCRRCLEFGHLAFNCTKKLKPVTCCLCGEKGHKENRCPNTVCTSCGLKTPCYTTFCQRCVARQHVKCSICSMFGHMDSYCPDLWRRYLFTIKEGAMQQPTEGAAMKQFEDIWCSGCGGNGHLEQNCQDCRRVHPPASVFVYNTESVYDDSSCNANQSGQTTEEEAGWRRWHLDPAHCKLLVGREASVFLQILTAKIGVHVRITKKNRHVEFWWSKDGERNVLETMAAVQRFINTKRHKVVKFVCDVRKASVRDLQANLDLLTDSRVNWLAVARQSYSTIKALTSSISGSTCEREYLNQQNQLKLQYRRLNAIIIARLQIGTDRTHMETLADALKTGQIPAPTFEYVFNSARILYPNYPELIAQLPGAINFEKMKNKAIGVCQMGHLMNRMRKIISLYSHLIVSDYSDECVSAFKLACSLTKKTRRKKKKPSK